MRLPAQPYLPGSDPAGFGTASRGTCARSAAGLHRASPSAALDKRSAFPIILLFFFYPISGGMSIPLLQRVDEVAFAKKSVPSPDGTTFANQPSESPAKRVLSGANVKKPRSYTPFCARPLRWAEAGRYASLLVGNGVREGKGRLSARVALYQQSKAGGMSIPLLLDLHLAAVLQHRLSFDDHLVSFLQPADDLDPVA